MRQPWPNSYTEVYFVPGFPGVVFPDSGVTGDQGAYPETDALMFHGVWRQEATTFVVLPPDPDISRYAPRVHAPDLSNH